MALAQAQAALAQTVREVRSLYISNATWAANIAQREAEVDRARTDLARAEDDLARRQTLRRIRRRQRRGDQSCAIGASATRAARSPAPQAALASAQQQLATNQSLTDGTTVEKHPNVERAAAKVREAYLAYARTTLPAPVSGYVAKRTVQVGQRVAPGAPLMSIVPLDQVWVDANFKEVQLRRMRIGQPVTLTADAYGSAVEYHGTVAGLGVGTAAPSRCCPRRTPPATGSRWSSACRCASRSTRRSSPSIRCASACRWKSRSTWPTRRARTLAAAPRGGRAVHHRRVHARCRGSRRARAQTIAANLGWRAKPSASATHAARATRRASRRPRRSGGTAASAAKAPVAAPL